MNFPSILFFLLQPNLHLWVLSLQVLLQEPRLHQNHKDSNSTSIAFFQRYAWTSHCFIVIYGINLTFLYNGLERLSQIHESIQLFNNTPTMMRHQCTKNRNGQYWIYSILCIVGLSFGILQSTSLFALLHIIQSSLEIQYLQQQTPSAYPDYEVIILKSFQISYKLIHFFRKRGIIQSLRYIPKEYGK